MVLCRGRQQEPIGLEADDLAAMLFGQQPGGSDPALDPIAGAPARDILRSLLHTALRILNYVRGAEALIERRRQWQALQGEHFRQAFP